MIPLKLLLEELNTDINRKKWDKNFVVVENIEKNPPSDYLLYTVFSVLGFKQEYLEKKLVFLKNQSVYIVVYSVEDERKPITNITRAHTFFGVIIISERNSKIEINVYNQTNPNSLMLKLGTSIGISKLSDWANSFTKHISKLRLV